MQVQVLVLEAENFMFIDISEEKNLQDKDSLKHKQKRFGFFICCENFFKINYYLNFKGRT